MKIRIIIEYEPDVDHANISNAEMREVAHAELEDWKKGNVTLADFADPDPDLSFAITVEYDR